eukprot:m.36298 g.36298  ORF g.36298 m.36298 type:complete len:279 (-) comp11254_c0_seq1:828-1664(-)
MEFENLMTLYFEWPRPCLISSFLEFFNVLLLGKRFNMTMIARSVIRVLSVVSSLLLLLLLKESSPSSLHPQSTSRSALLNPQEYMSTPAHGLSASRTIRLPIALEGEPPSLMPLQRPVRLSFWMTTLLLVHVALALSDGVLFIALINPGEAADNIPRWVPRHTSFFVLNVCSAFAQAWLVYQDLAILLLMAIWCSKHPSSCIGFPFMCSCCSVTAGISEGHASVSQAQDDHGRYMSYHNPLAQLSPPAGHHSRSCMSTHVLSYSPFLFRVVVGAKESP